MLAPLLPGVVIVTALFVAYTTVLGVARWAWDSPPSLLVDRTFAPVSLIMMAIALEGVHILLWQTTSWLPPPAWNQNPRQQSTHWLEARDLRPQADP